MAFRVMLSLRDISDYISNSFTIVVCKTVISQHKNCNKYVETEVDRPCNDGDGPSKYITERWIEAH